MKDKSGDKTKNQAEENTSSVDTGADAGIVVEEQVLERHHYDNTTSFEMDIEKAKAIATKQPHASTTSSDAEPLPQINSAITEEEKERLKQSLAELREQEQSDADEYDNRSGLFGKIKSLFSNK